MRTGQAAATDAVRSPFAEPNARRLDPRKFHDPERTLDGSVRARVAMRRLKTLWVNTGTLCNITCAGCYIESSPRNDELTYFRADELRAYLDEARDLCAPLDTVGFTGGEPFMNPQIVQLLELALERGLTALVLTNAMRPMRRHEAALARLRTQYGAALRLRVSLDHHTRAVHDLERGAGSWEKATSGLAWLAGQGFGLSVAGRHLPGEAGADARRSYQALFDRLGARLDAADGDALILFPEMDASVDTPEITEACWSLLGKSPADVMCASSRMLVHRRGADGPAVVACTLTPYDPQFELGRRLEEALGEVRLNHPHCARFCVLGGSSCAGG